MLISPCMRLVFLGLLATLVPLVDGKGGDGGGHGSGHSSGGSSSKGSKSTSKGSSGSKAHPIIITNNSSGHRECIDSNTNQIVKCPADKKADIIAGAVIGGMVGLLLIAALIWWLLRRHRHNRGRSATRELEVPAMSSPLQKEYKTLESEQDLSKPKDAAENKDDAKPESVWWC